jgi:enoyl-CoA hydratase/carnithine racemase
MFERRAYGSPEQICTEYPGRLRSKPAQIRLTKRSPTYWRVTIDNPPINVMGPEMVRHFQEVINALEADEQVRVVVFDSAVDDYFLSQAPRQH